MTKYFIVSYMAIVAFKGKTIHTSGELPSVGSASPDFKLVSKSLDRIMLASYAGKKKILNIVPSFDTSTCAKSAKFFERRSNESFFVIGISRDTPFAQARFCKEGGISHSVMLSDLDHAFGKDYGLEIKDGSLAYLLARAIIVLDENNTVLYTELVSEITDEPHYEAALKFLQ